jgi:pimeloyl-ACP methyl ester carboxylesterase
MFLINVPLRAGRWAAAASVAVALLLLAAPLSQARSTHRNATAAKPTIVLVHGAWADGSSWSKVTRRLQRAGYTVDVPPNLLRGLKGDSDYLAAYLTTIKGPIVLAGHSYGGAVITNAATANAAVKALVYVDAYIPDQGESALQLTSAKPGSGLDPKTSFIPLSYPGAVGDDVDLYLTPTAVRTTFAQDVSATRQAVLAAAQRPVTGSALGSPSGPPAWKSIPSWAVIGTEDRVIPPAEQVVMTDRAHAKTTKVDASHVSMISRPDAVTKVIVDAAQATG